MRGDPQMSFVFPKPGPVLKAILIALVAFGVLGALLFNWGPSWGKDAFLLFVFKPDHVLQLWRFVTSGLLSNPQMSAGPLLFTVLGLYFLGPDLERRWGGKRFAAFLAASVAVGNLFVFAVSKIPGLENPIFHPAVAFGATAAIWAVTVAWAQDNAESEVRLMFFLPVKGKHLFWFAVVYAVAGLIWSADPPEGVMSPFGGIAAGMTMSNSPSILRRTYLELKLALLKRRATALRTPPRPTRKARSGGPSLRVLPGGLEEELKKRDPPNDKRYLN
jgi:membrane associated rhomboid family serine protease